MADFRFENLEVWKMAMEIGHRVADSADRIEASGRASYANRLRDLSCSISSILAAGSSCPTKLEFSGYVARARQSTLEIANLILFYAELDLITEKEESELVNMLKRESKMLDNFRQSLERAERATPETVDALV